MEILARDLQQLPPVIVKLLHQVQELDRVSHKDLEDVRREEAQLIQEVADLVKAGNKDFDEAPYQNRLNDIVQKRQNITKKLDDQVNLSQYVYNLLDDKIRYLDDHMKDIPYLYVEDLGGESKKKKKKRKKDAEEEEEVNELGVDPNEPVYCVCRRVSFGNMIACENPDCLVEWFHYPCVNLTSEPKGKWYCPDCSNSMNK